MGFEALRLAGAPLPGLAGPAKPLQRDQETRYCQRGGCGRTLRGKQASWCSETCRWKVWDEAHPRLDFTPAASELAHAIRGRETKAQRILARLRQGPATTWQLAQTGGIRFGARILELRRAGHRITTVEHADHAVYSLEGE